MTFKRMAAAALLPGPGLIAAAYAVAVLELGDTLEGIAILGAAPAAAFAAAYLLRDSGWALRLACASVALAWTVALLITVVSVALVVSCGPGECFR